MIQPNIKLSLHVFTSTSTVRGTMAEDPNPSSTSIFQELGLISSSRNSNGNEKGKKDKQSKNKKKQQDALNTNNSITALDILQRLLETNVVNSSQIQSAHASLKEERNNNLEAAAAETETANSASGKEQQPSSNPTTTFSYRRRHIALRVYYEGKEYSGLAQNMGQESDNSVEQQLFAALCKTHLIESRETCQYSRCGRTDKGVSAVGQVIALQLKSAIPLEASWDEQGQKLVQSNNEKEEEEGEKALPKNTIEKIRVWVPPKAKNKKGKADNNNKNNASAAARQCKEISEFPYDKMINSVLPENIRILGWTPVSQDFSARFSASTRTYRYFFVRRRSLSLDVMRQALRLLEGTHDFRNFCKLNVIEVSNFVRKIHAAELVCCPNSNDVCYFQIHGQAFLWHQIRCIVSVLFLIGRGLESPDVISELLNVDKYPGKPSYPLAAEFPLVLHECGYPNLQTGYSVQNLWSVTCQLEEQWETALLEAARIQNCLNMLRHDVTTLQPEDLKDFCKRRLLERQKKRRRSKASQHDGEDIAAFLEQIEKDQQPMVDDEDGNTQFLTWDQAISWMEKWNMIPDANALRDHVHVPLLERSKGTTYEEKIESLQVNSTKRSQRYEENVAKKRKAEDGDGDFYDHKLRQGGSAV